MRYESARPHIKSGDLLAFSHFGWKTWHDWKIQGVRMFTRSEYSHVGIAWVVGERVFCLEAVMPLVRIYPLDKLGEFYWIPTNVNWTKEIEDVALSIVGQEYSQWQAIQSFFDAPTKDHLWQCCEYAMEILYLAGIDIDSPKTPTGIVRGMMQKDYSLLLVEPPEKLVAKKPAA